MTAIAQHAPFDALIDHERLLVVPEKVEDDSPERIAAVAREHGLFLDTQGTLHRAHRERHGGKLTIHQDLSVDLDGVACEADGTLVVRQELRLKPSDARPRLPIPGPLTQSERQVWLYGDGASGKAGELREALCKSGLSVGTSYVYRVARRPEEHQRYAADPWLLTVRADKCESAELRETLEGLLEIEHRGGPWYDARVTTPRDLHEVARDFERRIRGRAQLSFRPLPLVVPLCGLVPPEAASGAYNLQQENYALIDAEAMWQLFQDSAPANPADVRIFLLDCGIHLPNGDLTVDVGRSRLIDRPFGGDYLRGCAPKGDHGTRMAGILHARWNGFGIAGVTGVASAARIALVSLRCQTASLSNHREALVYAGDNLDATKGVVVIGADVLQLYADAVAAAPFAGEADWFADVLTHATLPAGKDLLVVVPSGNGNTSIPGDEALPAALPPFLDGTVIVGACDADGNRWQDPLVLSRGSRFGPALTLVAPGDHVWSTVNETDYGYGHGTSFAAAYVGGVAALMRAVNGTRTARAIKIQIRNNTTKVPVPPATHELGNGRVNGFAAVRAAL